MAQQNGFGSGFVLGTLIGGVVGGVLGTILATRKDRQIADTSNSEQKAQEISFGTEERIELARHGLEDKIAQLNLAIDDVKQQLGAVETQSEKE